MSDDVYYRIYIAGTGPALQIVHMQSFDEPDYDQTRFLCANKFVTEEEAQSIIDGIHQWMGRLFLRGIQGYE